MEAPRVLFLHGLETDPRKLKTSADGSLVRAFGASVHGPDLEIGTADLGRANSVARNMLLLPPVQAAMVLSAASTIAGGLRRLPFRIAAAGASLPLAGIAANYERLKGHAIEQSLERCVERARTSMESFKPDVLSGMSWGGAVASLLVQRGHWTGPIVLLAPAGQQIATYLNRDSKARAELELPLPAGTRGVIIHGTDDRVVPVEHSHALKSESKALKLTVVHGDDHGLRLSRPLVKTVLERAAHKH